MRRSSSSFRRSGGRSMNHQRVSRNERAVRVKAPSLFPHSAAKQHVGKKDDDQNSSARLVAVSESGNHLVSFFALTQIVFTASFALTDRYGKPNSKKKTGTQVEQFSRLAPSRTVTSYSSFFGEAEPV